MRILFILLTLISLNAFGQFRGDVFEEMKVKNFFKAKEIYEETKTNYTEAEQEFIEANLDNAFNQTRLSNEKITNLLSQKFTLPDAVQLKLYRLQIDNFIKEFAYKNAAETINFILENYAELLGEKELDDLKNSYQIWYALQNTPQQTVKIPSTTRQKLKIDKAGLKNQSVFSNKDSIDFIFDTGANISTVIASTAKKMNMKIIPAGIEVGTITGQTINADLAVCPVMKIGAIEIRNAVFLVMSDEALYIPQI